MAAHTGNDIDVNFLQQILLYNNSKYLLWDGYKPDGTKKQSWVKGAVDLELHVKGIKKQGGLLIEDGKSKNIVIDIDGEIPADKIAAAAFKIDTNFSSSFQSLTLAASEYGFFINPISKFFKPLRCFFEVDDFFIFFFFFFVGISFVPLLFQFIFY